MVFKDNIFFQNPVSLQPAITSEGSEALHFNTAINNFGIQEYMPHQEIVNEVFKTNYTFADGFMTIDDSPGTGVGIDENAAARYPYVMARLPVNRKSDGTMFNW